MKISKQLINWFEQQGIQATPEEIEVEFKKLDDRQQQVISLRFDFEHRALMPLEDVAKEFGVTRERIRQHQNIALRGIKGKLQRSRLSESDKQKMLIENLGLAQRELNCLQGALNCKTVEDVMNLSLTEIKRHRFITRRVLQGIYTAFNEIGIDLGWK